MSKIALLSQDTIDKIAAGEVVERPSSVVKELTENAIDAGAKAVTVEIRDGGSSLIRVTDNGCGIAPEEVRAAFLRHATSKITSLDDLQSEKSLGFRGEALSSIAAVSQVEMITKVPEELLGVRYVIEGGNEQSLEEIGAPDGTTILVRNLFYHTPARKKFLKSAATEASYVSEMMERLALSHPDISFQFISNREVKLFTSGSGKLIETVCAVYGEYSRDFQEKLIEIDTGSPFVHISGYIGKPEISRGNRNYENYFVNGRYVRNAVVNRAVEDAYKPYLMSHRFPFTVLMLTTDPAFVDVNVHPAKMEVRFADQNEVYDAVFKAVKEGLLRRELIPEVSVDEGLKKAQPKPKKEKAPSYPEPFETKRESLLSEKGPSYEPAAPKPMLKPVTGTIQKSEQMELFDDQPFLSEDSRKRHRLIGQVFDTYWIVEFEDKLYIIDQHAAHEKVLYERFLKELSEKRQNAQQLAPPLIVTLSMQEEELLSQNMDSFTALGFEIEPFGGKEYAIRSVPGNLYGFSEGELFTEMLDELTDVSRKAGDELICEKLASMACKAAVKGRHRMDAAEADALIGELLTLDNPYNCPHGRPTIIEMSKRELEKKFKRIV